jgi:hypothetical protein
MKKTTIIFLLLVAAGVAFLYWNYVMNQKSVSQTEIEQVAIEGVTPADRVQSISGMGTLAELRAQDKDLECQIVYEQGNEPAIEGTYFTSQGNIRGDFLVPLEGSQETMLSSMIIGGDALYVWSAVDGQLFGVKTALNVETTVVTKEPVPIDAMVKYTCSDWGAVDGSIFIPPTQVMFQDAGALIEAGMEDGTIVP